MMDEHRRIVRHVRVIDVALTVTLPGVEAVELPAFDAEVPCLWRFDGELCGRAATWRLSMTCCGCGARVYEVTSAECRLRLLVLGFPDRGARITTHCCGVPIKDVSWSLL